MDRCCNLSYQNIFDTDLAKKELADYRRKGVKKSSQPLLKVVQQLSLADCSLLDIGGGVGAITFELFKAGISTSSYVDISQAYRSCFLEEVHKQALGSQVNSQLGDFLEVHQDIESVDLVTLDKVICCYEDYQQLVEVSASKTRRWYAYSVPRDIWWVRWGHRLEQFIRRLQGKRFRSFIHPTAAIEQQISALGFNIISTSIKKEWMAILCERKTP